MTTTGHACSSDRQEPRNLCSDQVRRTFIIRFASLFPPTSEKIITLVFQRSFEPSEDAGEDGDGGQQQPASVIISDVCEGLMKGQNCTILLKLYIYNFFLFHNVVEVRTSCLQENLLCPGECDPRSGVLCLYLDSMDQMLSDGTPHPPHTNPCPRIR